MEGMSPTDCEERPSLVMYKIEPMDNERRQRIDDVIGNIEGVTTDLDESKSRSIKDTICHGTKGSISGLCAEDPGTQILEVYNRSAYGTRSSTTQDPKHI